MFNSFETKNEQDVFLLGQIQAVPIQRRKLKLNNNGAKRSSSYRYHVLKQELRIQVCKKAFMGLYARNTIFGC